MTTRRFIPSTSSPRGPAPGATTSGGIRKPTISGSSVAAAATAAVANTSASLVSDAVREQRARRNRESAKRSRLRTKLYVQRLEAGLTALAAENLMLRRAVEAGLPRVLDAAPGLAVQLLSLVRAAENE